MFKTILLGTTKFGEHKSVLPKAPGCYGRAQRVRP